MSSYEALGHEDGHFLIQDDRRNVVIRLPIVAIHEGVTVCEFRRETALSLETTLSLIQRELLDYYLDRFYHAPEIEFVDLDEARWARATPGTIPQQWISTTDAWPPGIERRTTALVDAPSESLLNIEASFPFPSKLRILTPAEDGCVVAVVQGEGIIRRIDLRNGELAEIGRIDSQVLGLTYVNDRTLVARTESGIHVLRSGTWQHLGLEGVSAVSSDGRHIAVGTRTGDVCLLDATNGSELYRFPVEQVASEGHATQDLNRIWSISFTGDGSHVVIGRTLPILGVYDVRTGTQTARHEGSVGMLRDVFTAGERILVSLEKREFNVLGTDGRMLRRLPTSGNYGLSSGGFARGGALIVTTCHEPVARIWRVSDGALLGQAPCAKGEPLAVTDDAFFCRDQEKKLLVRVSLSETRGPIKALADHS